jgi:hypothetical protein
MDVAPEGGAPAAARGGGRGRGGGFGRGGGRGGRGGFGAVNFNDKQSLEQSYAYATETYDAQEYLYTEGGFWIDRTLAERQSTGEMQRMRLGGVAHLRNDLLPGHYLSWNFHAPANDQSTAILVSNASPTGMKIVAYNLEKSPVNVAMTGWNIDPGIWDITQGIDTNKDDVADQSIATRSAPFEQSASLELTLPPQATTVLTLKLKTPGTPYWKRPDIGIDKEDVVMSGNSINVTVHGLGSVDSVATTVALLDPSGKTIASAPVPAIKAPIDLMPRTSSVTLTIPSGATTKGCSVVLDPDMKMQEITRLNNRVGL